MLRLFSRRFHAGIEIAALLALTCIAAFGQSTSSQPVSTQALSGQSVSGQPSVGASSGQSLGDVARANQKKKAVEGSSGAPSKVFTNANLPKNPDGYTAPAADQDEDSPPSSAKSAATRKLEERHANQQRGAEERAAMRWKQQISTQKWVVANLQSQVDELRTFDSFYKSERVPTNRCQRQLCWAGLQPHRGAANRTPAPSGTATPAAETQARRHAKCRAPCWDAHERVRSVELRYRPKKSG